MAKADPRALAVAALSQALADPAPKPLFGTAKVPGFFKGAAQAVKAAGAQCEANGWVEPTGQSVGKGKTAKPLYRITPAGVREALEHGDVATLLHDLLDALDANRQELTKARDVAQRAADVVEAQKAVVQSLFYRVLPPDLDAVLAAAQGESGSESSKPAAPQAAGEAGSAPAPADNGWLDGAVDYLQRRSVKEAYGHCPLPELFRQVAEPAGLTIGQFHDGVRRLVAQGRVRLHPFTGAAYQLQDEQYAIMAGQEIKYYAEPVSG